jgi:hypothetical protein
VILMMIIEISLEIQITTNNKMYQELSRYSIVILDFIYRIVAYELSSVLTGVGFTNSSK